MISTSTRIRVKGILNRLKKMERVTLEERNFLTKLSRISAKISGWITTSLGEEANSIDNE